MITYLENINSTQDAMHEAFFTGEANQFDAIIAQHQTGGRGRNGHVWEDTSGTALLSSTLVHMDASTPQHQIGFMAALAARRAIAGFTSEVVSIKWPNDILALRPGGGSKIAGIISEHLSSDDKKNYFSVGFGLNIFQKHEELPKGTAIPATSLILSEPIRYSGNYFEDEGNRRELITSIYQDFNANLKEAVRLNSAQLRSALDEHLYPMERALITFVNADVFEAEVIGLSSGFGLLVQKDNGETVEVISGDVKPLH